MSLESVKNYLSPFGYADKILVMEQSTATVAEAAAALGIEEDQIAKSVSLLQDDHAVVIVVSGHSKIDNHKYKETFGKKAKMIPFDEVEKYTSHPAGGVCPFALPEDVKVFFDESLKKYTTVYPACGSRNSAIPIPVSEFGRICPDAQWVDVTQSTEEKHD